MPTCRSPPRSQQYNYFLLNNFSYSDSAAVAGCIATLISGIVDGDGDASDTSEDIALLAEAGKMITRFSIQHTTDNCCASHSFIFCDVPVLPTAVRCIHDLLLLLGDVLSSVGSKDGSYSPNHTLFSSTLFAVALQPQSPHPLLPQISPPLRRPFPSPTSHHPPPQHAAHSQPPSPRPATSAS